jgi:putative addiction module killer protein
MVWRIRQTVTFARWLDGLKDLSGRSAILQRLVRLQRGLLGDAKALGGGLHELRIDRGPGYRLYFTRQGEVVIVLLCGGDKSSQNRDIARARQLIGSPPEIGDAGS